MPKGKQPEQWVSWGSGTWTKHHPVPGHAAAETDADTSRGGASRYYVQARIREIEERVAREGISVVCEGKPGTEAKVLEFAEPVGASDGKPSRWVFVESTSGVYHGYPIPEEAFQRHLKGARKRR